MRINLKLIGCLALAAGVAGLMYQGEHPRPSSATAAELSGLSVSQLVDQLASPLAPERVPPAGYDEIRYLCGGYTDPQVIAASQELHSRGPSVVPELLQHQEDQRYCWTSNYAARVDHSVGSQVRSIAAGIMAPELQLEESQTGGFKGEPGFEQYFYRCGPEKYVSWARQATMEEAELAYLRWHVDQLQGMKKWIDADAHSARFRKRIAELEQVGVATAGPLAP
ncbi:hypothetical protein [Lignipirellula cremea]|uniref:Uncharacterized protein n=1 Tax=Lignipirellula cremea TaxID=2528010 RepID=A0A518DVB9_9BACT|nr:hypothetical protein [Lignipirellula cremea]QDU95774.1 hypothetical protein Pla8534_35910 [Lignipirellula cremea]